MIDIHADPAMWAAALRLSHESRHDAEECYALMQRVKDEEKVRQLIHVAAQSAVDPWALLAFATTEPTER